MSRVLSGGRIDGCKVVGTEEGTEARGHGGTEVVIKVTADDKEMGSGIMGGDF